jgi:uncharacterized membrane protein YuzA (DUF378 family)
MKVSKALTICVALLSLCAIYQLVMFVIYDNTAYLVIGLTVSWCLVGVVACMSIEQRRTKTNHEEDKEN